jgi:hypothetical protein
VAPCYSGGTWIGSRSQHRVGWACLRPHCNKQRRRGLSSVERTLGMGSSLEKGRAGGSTQNCTRGVSGDIERTFLNCALLYICTSAHKLSCSSKMHTLGPPGRRGRKSSGALVQGSPGGLSTETERTFAGWVIRGSTHTNWGRRAWIQEANTSGGKHRDSGHKGQLARDTAAGRKG